MGEPRTEGTDLGLSGSERAQFSASISSNNIRVTLGAVAGGITAGLLTGGILIFNGVLIGVVAGVGVAAGNGSALVELILPHGVLELSCIVVTAAAGLRFGWAMIEPHRKGRVEAVVAEARDAVQIVLGTMPWLVLAGLIEGFITPAGLVTPAVVVVGFGVGAAYWVLVLWRGRAASR